MPLPRNLLTTAMGVMPHKNVDQALKLSMSLDIPFWPQLPLYTRSIINFLERGGIIVWGIVPTNIEPFERETTDSLIKLLESTWKKLYKEGLDRDFLLSRSLLSPATCCLINPDAESI